MFRVVVGKFAGQWLLNDIWAGPCHLVSSIPIIGENRFAGPANPACAFMRMIKTYRCPELSVARHFSF